ncbi:MAG: DUF4199 domain-containing protein [Bacteroidales bacterium]
MMTNDKNKTIRFAMQFGLYLGLYMILKFATFVLSANSPFFSYISLALLTGAPFLLFWMLRTFRDQQNEGVLSFANAWNLSILLIFFASLIEAITQYVYFQFINPEFISTQIAQATQVLETLNETQQSGQVHELVESFKKADIPSPIQMAVQGIFNNIFVGSIAALIVAAAVKRNPNH